MRVVVDGRSLREASARGVSHYTRSLVTALGRLYPKDRYAIVLPGPDDGEERLGFDAPNVEVWRTRLRGRALHGVAAALGRPRLDRLAGGCDVLWAPTVAPLATSPGVPLVLTVHDLSFHHRPGDFTPYARAWHALARPRRLAARARRVIAVSDATRRDLLVDWALPGDKVVTVRSGPGRTPPPQGQLGREEPLEIQGADGSAPQLPPSYVLAVGALEPRKDLDVLVAAHERARERGLTAELVLAGDGPLGRKLRRSGATVLGYVDEGVLERLYARALALVCPSREEGFGFTPLEALARGVPPVVSDLAVFSETLGDAALRFPAGDPHALADALLRLERDQALRGRIVASGEERLGALSWEQAACETRAVLADAAGQ